MSKPVDLLLAIIAHREISAITVNSLERLRQAQLDFSYTLGEFVGDALLARARSQACSRFLLDTPIPYMLFIDSDIEFQPQDVSKIYHDLKDGYDTIGGIYAVRGASQLASYGWGGYLEVDGKINEIEYLATGFMGISRRMLEKMRDELKLPYLNPKDWSKCYPFMEDGRTLRYEKLYKIVSDIFPKFSEHMMKQHLEELCRALGIRYRHQGDDIYISEDWDFPLLPTTPVIYSDFSWKLLGDVSIGDKLIGFRERKGNYRSYCESIVSDVQENSLDAYRIITENGEIVASGKHPLLAESPSAKAPRWITAERLRVGQRLKNPIQPYPNPTVDENYMKGYLKGVWEGDGTIDKHGYATLEMTDYEAVSRASYYARQLNFITSSLTKRELINPNWKPLYKLYCGQGIPNVENLNIKSESIARGFLAGIYDAEGSYSNGHIRIAARDPKIQDEILQALNYVGLNKKAYTRPDGLWEYSFSKQSEYFKFWQATQPAIKRKMSLDAQGNGAILQSQHPKILAVELIGKRDVRCITTDCGNFIANGYISHNCDKVRKVGGKVYADTLVQVGHMREQVFSPMDVRNLQQKQKMDETVYGAINHQLQLSQKLEEDLAEYLGMTIPKAREKMVEGSSTLARIWAEFKGKTEDFYKGNEEYVSQLSHFNSERMYFDSKVNQLVNISKQKILDIGCGIGTAVFMMAEQDNEVLGWDINKKVIEFAEFRKKKHGLKGDFTTEKPDFSQFDLIIAIDTLEHIENLREFLIDLGSKMKYGAKLYHADHFLREGKYPMRYEEHAQHLSEWLKEARLTEWDEKWCIRS